ncbi:MAG: AraC family transcriptional regulator [Rudaea sp.]
MTIANDSDFFSDANDSAETPRKRKRFRYRHRYPTELVGSVNALGAYLKPRNIALLLDVPLSTIYRWRSETNSGRAAPSVSAADGNGAVEIDVKSARNMKASNDDSNERRSPDIVAKLRAARELIEKDYFTPLDSHALAEAANMSRHHFIRSFNAEYGISPHQYLMTIRLRAAERLLQASNETIDVIAAATGFGSGSSLTRAFRRKTGVRVSQRWHSGPGTSEVV